MKDVHLKTPDLEAVFADRFRTYCARPVIEKALGLLGSGAEIEIRIRERGEKVREVFCYLKPKIKGDIRSGPGDKPQVILTLSPQAAVELLSNPSENGKEIGVHFATLMASPDPRRRLTLKLKAGVISLIMRSLGAQRFKIGRLK